VHFLASEFLRPIFKGRTINNRKFLPFEKAIPGDEAATLIRKQPQGKMSPKILTEGIASRPEPERIVGFFITGLHVLKRILNWLAAIIQLTEEEQKEAGIDLGYQHHK
jgi:hypothetical protein